MIKKKKLTLSQVKKFLLKKGLSINYHDKNFLNSKFKSIYYTVFSSFVIILFSTLLPFVVEVREKSILLSKEINNNSKVNFKKVLNGDSIKNKSKTIEEALDTKIFLEDLEFEFEDQPIDTVRLNAMTLEQLFQDTNYNLKDVRKTKLVKPIALSLLPQEIKKIENIKKRKNLFIKIILPLILEESNVIKSDRRKLFNILNKNKNSVVEKKWLNKKFKQYSVSNKDLSTLKIRMDIVPVSLVIAQAAKETGWGTSRFAVEGNALFGQWTWDGEGIKPASADNNDTHKVMRFKIMRASIRAYQRNLNTHASYKKFRLTRAEQRDRNENLNSLVLSEHLEKYAETGAEYVKILNKIIKQNSLTDFDDAKLLPKSIVSFSPFII